MMLLSQKEVRSFAGLANLKPLDGKRMSLLEIPQHNGNFITGMSL